MFMEFFLVGFVSICIGILLGKISRQNSEVKFHREGLEYKVLTETCKIQSELTEMKKAIDRFDSSMLVILSDISHRSLKVPVYKSASLPPANRQPRTQEQKLVAAEKKKAWWAAKRAKDANKKAQEQNTPTPGLQVVPEIKVS